MFKVIVKGAESQANDAQTLKELFIQLDIAIDSVAKNADETDCSDVTSIGKLSRRVKQFSFEIQNKQIKAIVL